MLDNNILDDILSFEVSNWKHSEMSLPMCLQKCHFWTQAADNKVTSRHDMFSSISDGFLFCNSLHLH